MKSSPSDFFLLLFIYKLKNCLFGGHLLLFSGNFKEKLATFEKQLHDQNNACSSPARFGFSLHFCHAEVPEENSRTNFEFRKLFILLNIIYRETHVLLIEKYSRNLESTKDKNQV